MDPSVLTVLDRCLALDIIISLCKVLASFSQAGVTCSAGGCAWVLTAMLSVHLSKPILNPSVHYSMKSSSCKHVLCGIKSLFSFETWYLGVLLIFLFSSSLLLPLQETIGEHLPCTSHGKNWFANVFLSLLLFCSEKEIGRVWYSPKPIPHFVLSWFFLQVF